ncbi:hypothetical protein GF361_02115 [Candidatus Woesearchaeota archaeon]|nr:hypothetical protein [Candidatus Woesearchaeota archaeon]
MKKERKTELMKKGWSKEEIKNAEDIIEDRKLHDKSRSMLRLDRILFWGILFMMAVGNALVAFILIPLLLVFNKLVMNLFVIVIGFSIGVLFNFLIWDIEEHLTRKHHLIAALSIPILALFNMYFIVKASNAINILFDISEVKGDPVTVSALYAIAFLLPYLWTLFVNKKIKKY